MAEPNPTEVPKWYLRNINQALGLDEATGNVFLRTDSQIIGNVSVNDVSIGALGNVNIASSTLPVSGNVIVNQGTTPWVIEPIIQSLDNAPFEWQVSRGLIPGAYSTNIFGYNPLIPTTPTTVWDGTGDYTFPAAASQLTVVSTSASDVGLSLNITGLDSNWNPIAELITLNGTNDVLTTTPFFRINSMVVRSPSPGQISNIGTITARIGATTYAQINPTIGRTQMAVYSVRAGHTLLVQQISAFSGDATGTSKFMNFQADIIDRTTGEDFILLQTTWQNSYQVRRVNPVAYNEKTDLRWKLFTNSGTATGSIIVEGTLVSNV